nr:PAS domain S-box protein [Steroidobacteraceae bacterium]
MQDEDERLAEVEHFQPRDTASTPALDRLAQLAASLFRAPMAAVSLVDGDRQWLKARCGLDLTSTAREHALCSHVLPLGPSGILVVPDAAQDARFAANPLVTGAPCIRFYAGAALTSRQGHVLGALCVIDSRPHPEPDKDSLNQLRVLADAVVDLLELERIARAQDEQVNLLKMAEGVSGMGHWRLDLRSKRVVWSKEVYAIHGLSPDSFDPNLDRAVDFYHPDDQPKVHAALDEAISSAGPVGFQLRLRCADGDVRDVVGRSLCERDRSDTPVAVFGVFQDITEHTRALAAARRNEERYRLLAENMADVVTRIRPDGSSNYISPAIERLLGYRPEEMAGRSAQDFVHPEDQAAVASVFATLCRSEAQRTIEVRAVRKDGALRWVEVSFRSMPMEKGGFEIVAVIRDITARRELESAAAERERLYRLLADNSIDLINRSSLDCEILYVSPSARELTGYEPDELIGRKTTDLI